MSIVYRKIIRNSCMLGIWKTTEDFDTLFSSLTLDESQRKTLDSFKSLNRKLEWMSVRALLNDLLQRNTRIIYNGDRKPYLEDRSYNISISHSKELTAILLSKDCRVGIDLEYMTPRISSIAYKFINERERLTNDLEKRTYHLYVHWCAKEALYKICNRKNLNFRDSFTIDPFPLDDEGTITGSALGPDISEVFNLNYFRIENYSIVWCCKSS
jgi:4'-phosphopantetheinyl transferase